MRFVFASFLFLVLTSCAGFQEKPAPQKLTLTPISFADLEGWQADAPAAALVAFQKSCEKISLKPSNASLGIAGKIAAWQWACAAAARTANNEEAARTYFEEWFRPFAAAGAEGDYGLFTGYYTPELRGSLRRGGAFQTPLYGRPADLIGVDLGAFKPELKGQHLVGKVQDTQLIPYDDRAMIVQGALASRAQPLVWGDDPVDAFFLEVQGSGRVRLTDGSVLPIGFDGANGRAYVAIGRVLADRGDLPRPVTMPAIRAWLAAHPQRAQEAMNINPSYVFFRRMPNEDAVGAEGVALTAERSLAVDTLFIPLGVPVWLETFDGHGAALQRLMIAQDTGGAIKGPIRGDVFWGAGEDAAAQAGTMQSRGRYFVLLPKTVSPNDD